MTGINRSAGAEKRLTSITRTAIGTTTRLIIMNHCAGVTISLSKTISIRNDEDVRTWRSGCARGFHPRDTGSIPVVRSLRTRSKIGYCTTLRTWRPYRFESCRVHHFAVIAQLAEHRVANPDIRDRPPFTAPFI